jgi:hypothetical protein
MGSAARKLDSTIGRSSSPGLKGLSTAPMTGGTGADAGPRAGRTDFERIGMDIDATNGIGGNASPGPIGAARGEHVDETGEFARVLDIAEARRRRMTGPDQIPEEVWDDITRAGQLADDLAQRGEQLRFDTHRLTNRVVASLCDSDGRTLRPVSMGEIFGIEPDPAPAA